MATIDDVAARAGVSIATVSRVMNNSYVVSQVKRDRVLEAARALNYQISRGQARKAANRTILIVGSAFIFNVIAGIQFQASEENCEVLFSFANRPDGTLDSIGLINRGQVDGIILLNYLDHANELPALSRKFPIVHCGGTRRYPDSRIIAINNKQAAYEAVMHLAGIGRRRIALLLPEVSADIPDYILAREAGYKAALAENGLDFDPELIYQSDLSPDSLNEMVEHILTLADRPDGLFCVTDQLGVGALGALQAAGISIPGEMALVGFDNDEISELCRPGLTTIAQPWHEIGGECVRQLVSMMQEDSFVGRQIFLAHELIVRGSTVG
ncbi:MAG: LacI family DNA-binding transcriptional regulator [Saccharofermentanales bacterium]|jgi:LacI family repressor for deo operon, udp, cdd, tsx, nupC, and nupG|nr:LacI family transcriptional regulator [Clostridiaceae bacterium]